jgi:translation initiation factor 3 subunit A
MQHFQKPENALRRADELYAVGQKDPALVALHDVLSSKRHRVWQPMMDEVMKRFLTICVEMRKGKAAKDGLVQYRIICQQVNVASMEAVLRHFMGLAEEGAQAALDLAEKTISDKVESLLDFEDLEAEETPESLMLATIGGSADSKKRTDRQVVTPALKFLWEAYRSVLDVLRNNVKLEDLYRDTTSRAFGFCRKYKRSVEFRRLCEILRNHITAQTKYDSKWKDREPPTPESLQMHLETRFAQLSTAIEMELWQEAYRTVEDVHSLLQLMKKPPKPVSVAAYHENLAKVFWVADNKLFHAYAVARTFTTSLSFKTPPSAEAQQLLASRAVLAALSISPASPVLDLNLLEYDLEHEKTKRMAQMLAFPTAASRTVLLNDVRRSGLLAKASPTVRELHALVERDNVPLDLAAAVAPILESIKAVTALAQYESALRRLVALRMLQQMERLYLTISIAKAAAAIPLLSWPELEALIVWATKKELLSLRVDYKHGRLNQPANKVDAAASSEVRESLASFAIALDAVNERLHAAELAKRKAATRARLYAAMAATAEEEHQAVLSRRVVIERRKEEAERVQQEEGKEKVRLRALKVAEEEAEEKARLQADATRRDAERDQREREQEEAAQRRKLAEQMAEQRKALKVTKKKGGEGGKVETDVDKLAEKDRGELMREQRELLMDERAEFERRLDAMAKRHDHLERARREEERELLELRWSAQQAEDKRRHDEHASALALQMKETRAHDVEEKKRFSRMVAAADAFTERVLAVRRAAHKEVVAAWREEQKARREAVRAERERVAAEEKAREEAIDRARREAEEEEALRIQEEQEAIRKKAEEEEERKRVLERQRQREKELEEKAALERLAQREQIGKSWAADDDDELPALEMAKTFGGPVAVAAAAAAQPAVAPPAAPPSRPAPKPFERRERAPTDGDGWETHRMGSRNADGPPARAADRWSGPPARGGGVRDGPPPRDLGDRPPPREERPPPRRDLGDRPPPSRDLGDRQPPQRDLGDRPPPRRDFGGRPPPSRDFGDRPQRDMGDRPPPRRDGGSDRLPPRDFGDSAPPLRDPDRAPPQRDAGPPRRDFSDRGPPPRDFGDRRGPPPRDFGDRGAPRDDRGPPRDDRGPPPRRDDRAAPTQEGRADQERSWRR